MQCIIYNMGKTTVKNQCVECVHNNNKLITIFGCVYRFETSDLGCQAPKKIKKQKKYLYITTFLQSYDSFV